MLMPVSSAMLLGRGSGSGAFCSAWSGKSAGRCSLRGAQQRAAARRSGEQSNCRALANKLCTLELSQVRVARDSPPERPSSRTAGMLAESAADGALRSAPCRSSSATGSLPEGVAPRPKAKGRSCAKNAPHLERASPGEERAGCRTVAIVACGRTCGRRRAQGRAQGLPKLASWRHVPRSQRRLATLPLRRLERCHWGSGRRLHNARAPAVPRQGGPLSARGNCRACCGPATFARSGASLLARVPCPR